MRLEELSSVEFKKRVAKDPIVFIPVGATEAHGPHLPLNTDSVQPEAMADILATKFHGLVAPPVRYGNHSSTKNMPGTITLSFDTTRALLRDILDSLASNGLSKFVVLSGHAGSAHMTALKLACEEVVKKRGSRIMLLTDYDLAKTFPVSLEGDGHGGLLETSRMMHLAPDLVRTPKKKGRFLDQGYMVVENPEKCYPQGFVGDPTKASAELGERINDHIIKELSRLIRKNFGERE